VRGVIDRSCFLGYASNSTWYVVFSKHDYANEWVAIKDTSFIIKEHAGDMDPRDTMTHTAKYIIHSVGAPKAIDLKIQHLMKVSLKLTVDILFLYCGGKVLEMTSENFSISTGPHFYYVSYKGEEMLIPFVYLDYSP